MTKPITVLKSCGPKLVPFFKTCTIFFVLFAGTPASETTQPWFFCVVKCLPIISLIFFVLLHGMNLSEYYRYSRRILVGLIFSCMGDACLVWAKSYFELGIGCFAVAQIFYAKAFGWRPINPYLGAVVALLGSAIFYWLQINLKGIMVYMVAAYVGVICVMAWRAAARVQFFDDFVTWTKLSGFLGALAFVISDMTLAVDRFVMPLPYAHPIIMVTYYAAQFGIALSVVDSPVDEVMASSKRDQKEKEINEQIINGMSQVSTKTNDSKDVYANGTNENNIDDVTNGTNGGINGVVANGQSLISSRLQAVQ